MHTPPLRLRAAARAFAAALVLALAVAVAGTTAAHADPVAPKGSGVPAPPAIEGIEPVEVADVPESLRNADVVKGEPFAVTVPDADGVGTRAITTCTPFISKSATLNTHGPWTMQVDFFGDVSCTNYVSAYGVAYVYERTNGAPYNGSIVYAGGAFSFSAGTYGASYGSMIVHGGVYDGGQQLEIGLYLELATLDGSTWECQVPIPGLRYLTECQGRGTTFLQVEMGSNIFDTGLYPFMSLPLPDNAAGRAAYGRTHHDYPAVDIPVPTGTAVKAIRDGNATAVNQPAGCGNGISIAASDGATYVYCHFSSIAVGNTYIRAGTVIGYSGNTGSSTGPHLHVQIRSGGSLRCPQSMLQSIWDYVPPPGAASLPVSGCTH